MAAAPLAGGLAESVVAEKLKGIMKSIDNNYAAEQNLNVNVREVTVIPVAVLQQFVSSEYVNKVGERNDNEMPPDKHAAVASMVKKGTFLSLS